MEVEEAEGPLLMAAGGPVAVEEGEGRPCLQVEVLQVGLRRAQQGGLGKENLETIKQKGNFLFASGSC